MAAERDHIPIGVGADAAAENVEGVESAPVHLPHPAALAASCCCSCFAAGWLWLMGLAQVQVRLSRVEKRVIRIPALRFPAESLKHFKCVFELVWKVLLRQIPLVHFDILILAGPRRGDEDLAAITAIRAAIATITI